MMHYRSKLRWSKIVWKTDLAVDTADATRVRGFLGQRWKSITTLHQHAPDGGLIYRHPLIQTKVIDGEIVITGLAEGAMILEVLPNPRRLNLGRRYVEIVEEERENGVVFVGPTTNPTEYSFVTAWLPLNQTNVVKYLRASPNDRRDLLSRILIGNILSFSKGIQLNVGTRLDAENNLVEAASGNPKGIELLGFTGTCAINFCLPDLWGIGKFSSRGFGTLLRRQSDGQKIYSGF